MDSKSAAIVKGYVSSQEGTETRGQQKTRPCLIGREMLVFSQPFLWETQVVPGDPSIGYLGGWVLKLGIPKIILSRSIGFPTKIGPFLSRNLRTFCS